MVADFFVTKTSERKKGVTGKNFSWLLFLRKVNQTPAVYFLEEQLKVYYNNYLTFITSLKHSFSYFIQTASFISF